MSDARLDLEVAIEGTGAAARGLDDVADSSGRIGKTSGVVSPEVGKLSSAVNGLTRGASAANAAQSAMAQFMAGNFVGAFRSATVAVRGLWTAMWSNPLTAIMAGIALAASAVVIWSNRAKKAAEEAAEKAKEQLGILRSISEITEKDPQSVQIKRIQKLAEDGDSAAVEKGISTQQASVDRLEQNAIQKTKEAAENKNKKLQKEFDENRDAAIKMLEDSKRLLDAWKDAKKAIEQAKKEAGGDAAIDGGKIILPALEVEEGSSSDEIRRARLELERKKSVDKESDPIRKLQMQRKYLLEDMESESDGVKRIAIEEKIYDLEKRITAERERQVEQAKDDAKARAESANAEADAAKAAAAEHRAIAGEKNLGDQWGPEVADGWKIVDKRRRTLAGGSAGKWFAGRNDERKALLGATHTTEMGRPDIGADGKTNPAERTNQLLEKVVERLS